MLTSIVTSFSALPLRGSWKDRTAYNNLRPFVKQTSASAKSSNKSLRRDQIKERVQFQKQVPKTQKLIT